MATPPSAGASTRKRIDIDQLQLGMFVDGLCGPWIAHPFWRERFVLDDPAALATLRASGVRQCWIDTARGLDLAGAPVAVAAGVALPPSAPAAAPPHAALDDELARTKALLARSRAAVIAMFEQARLGAAVDTAHCQELVEGIAASVARNRAALIGLARLKTHDDYTYMHSVAVCALMIALARELGQGEAGIRTAGMAGLLHDLGKAVMPQALLSKPGKLSADEFGQMRMHPLRGHELLLQAGEASEAVLDVCLHHHEKVDGSGYPHGLREGQIGLQARMGAVCDVYDAVTSNRPYKQAWDPAEAIAKMAGWRRGHFDETVFQAFVKCVGIYPTGSLVRLNSGRLAVVVEQNAQALTTPTVKAFFSTRSQMPMAPELIDLARPGCADAIAGRESRREWNFAHLEELWAGADVLRPATRQAAASA